MKEREGTGSNHSENPWTIIVHTPPEDDDEYLDILLQIDSEDILLRLVDTVFNRFFSPYDSKKFTRLLRNMESRRLFSKALWQQFFKRECRLKNDYGSPVKPGAFIAHALAGNFRDLPWAAYCPDAIEGISFPRFLIKYGKFESEWGGEFEITDPNAANISYVFETLYQERDDFREQIRSMHGCILYGGSGGGFVGGTGDHEIGWNSSGSRAQYLVIDVLSEAAIKVSISHEKQTPPTLSKEEQKMKKAMYKTKFKG